MVDVLNIPVEDEEEESQQNPDDTTQKPEWDCSLNFRFSKMAEEIHHPEKEHDEEDELHLEDVKGVQANIPKSSNQSNSANGSVYSPDGCRILDKQVWNS